MFCGDGLRQKDEETFLLEIPENRDYKILQLTDLHLGFGLFSHKKEDPVNPSPHFDSILQSANVLSRAFKPFPVCKIGHYLRCAALLY